MNQTPIFPSSRLDRIRHDMSVVDESNHPLGTVKRVGLGDPQAVTTGAEGGRGDAPTVVAAPATGTGGAALGAAVPVGGDPLEGVDLPDQLRRELARTGFIEVDGRELQGVERYVSGDRIVDVRDDTVYVRRGPGSVPESSAFGQGSRSSSGFQPVLRTYPGAPHEAGQSRKSYLLPASAAVALLTTAAAAVVFYRRRQAARARPLNRLQRTMHRAGDVMQGGSGRKSIPVLGVIFAVMLLRRLFAHKEVTEPRTASATVTVSMPRWRRRR